MGVKLSFVTLKVLRTQCSEHLDQREKWIEQIKLCEQTFHNLYSLLSIVRVIKSRMRWAVHLVQMEKVKHTYKILVGNILERNHTEDLDVDGWIMILDWILTGQGCESGNWIDSGKVPVAGFYGDGDAPFKFYNSKEFLGELSNPHLLNEHTVPCITKQLCPNTKSFIAPVPYTTVSCMHYSVIQTHWLEDSIKLHNNMVA